MRRKIKKQIVKNVLLFSSKEGGVLLKIVLKWLKAYFLLELESESAPAKKTGAVKKQTGSATLLTDIHRN